jgi:hypothetical protein
MARDNSRYDYLIASGGRLIFGFVLTSMTLLIFVNAAAAQSFTKAQVADRIRKVEDGVDEFRKYLENRGDDARQNAQAAQSAERHDADEQIQLIRTYASSGQSKQRMIWMTL